MVKVLRFLVQKSLNSVENEIERSKERLRLAAANSTLPSVEHEVREASKTLSLRRDIDLLKVLRLMDEIGILDSEMTSVCLFDIYRGIFAPEKLQVESSRATSEVHASAKLSLMLYLLQSLAQQGTQDSQVSIKTFMGDLIDGMYRELVLKDASLADAKKSVDTGFD